MSKHSTGSHYLLLLGIAVIWGSQFFFNKVVIQELPPLTLAAGRATIGTLTLALLGLFMPQERRKAAQSARTLFPVYLQLALVEAVLPLILLSWGQSRIDSSIASILMGTIPIFTVLLAPLFVSGRHWSPSAVCSVLCGFVGIVILVAPGYQGGGHSSVLGELAVLGAAASVSVSLLLFNRLGDISPVISVRNILGLSAIVLALLSLCIDRPWTLHASRQTLGSLLVLGVFCAGVVYLMFARLIQLAGSVFTSLTNYLSPLIGMLLGALVAGESLGLNAWLALLFIAGALLINQQGRTRQPAEHASH